jgi:hypothetical protein
VTDREEIAELKARYFRLLDTKQWDALRDVFTDDMCFYRNEETEPSARSGDEFVASLRALLPTAVTVHQGHMPEITITGERSATGIWAMFDFVDDPSRNRAIHGYGHYHERYEKGDDGRWRIQELRLVRIRVDRVEPSSAEAVAAGRNTWLSRHSAPS